MFVGNVGRPILSFQYWEPTHFAHCGAVLPGAILKLLASVSELLRLLKFAIALIMIVERVVDYLPVSLTWLSTGQPRF